MAAVLLWVRGSWRHGRVGMLGVILLCGVAGAVVLTVAAGARRSSTSLDRLADATGAPDVLLDVTDADTTARDAVDASPIVADSGELSVVFAMVDGVEQDLGLFTLRSLGFTPRQSTAWIVWQAVTIGAVALVLGVPLGLIAGRGAWWAAADPIGVRTDISRPLGALLVLCVGTLVAATVLAAAVAWGSGRTTPAAALRTE